MTHPVESVICPRLATSSEETFRRRVYCKRFELSAVTAMALLYACSYFQRVAVPGTIFNQLQADFSLDAAGVTALASIYLYLYAASQLIVGFLADRVGGRRVIVAGGALLTVGAILFPLSQGPWQLYLSRALVGIGASAMFLSSVEQIDDMFTARAFSYLIGPLTVAGMLGGMLGTLPFERAAALAGWRSVLLGVGLCTGAALLLTVLVLRRLKRSPMLESEPLTLRPLAGVLANRAALPLIVGGSLNFAIYFTLQGVIGKKILEDHGGLSSAQAAAVLFAMILIAMTLTLMTGPISRLFGHRRKPPIVAGAILLLLSVLGGLAGLHLHSGAWLVFACFGCAVCSAAGPMYVCAMRECNSPDSVALSISVINTTTYLAVAALSNLVGLVLGAFVGNAVPVGGLTIYPAAAYSMIFAIFAGLSLLVLLTSCLVRERGTMNNMPTESSANDPGSGTPL